MNTKHVLSGLAVALVFVPAAVAQNPNKPAPPTPVTPPTPTAITLDAKPTTIVYANVTTLSGRLSGRSVRNVVLRLWRDTTRPYGDSYKPTTQTVRTANNGRYSLTAKPLVNTQYRVVTNVAPSVASPPKRVLVRIRTGIRLSDSTPRRGSRVRFYGSAFPAHDGRRVTIQRRSPSGRFVTVARTRLRDAGTAKSTYSRRVRVYRDGTYRVKVSGDGDHVNGLSRLKSIDVHG
jgi:hypothetical protein